MCIEDFELLDTEEKISYACLRGPVAFREMPPQYFYIVYKVDDFYVELRFNEKSKDRLADCARAFNAMAFEHYIRNNYYYMRSEDFL